MDRPLPRHPLLPHLLLLRGLAAPVAIAALGVVVLYPLAQPGYLVLLDLPLGPRPIASDSLPGNLAPLWWLLARLYEAVPAEVVGKAFAAAVLVGIGSAALLLGGPSLLGRLYAVVLCMVNPWVTDRLVVGQLPLLASYAAAIAACDAMVRVAERPTPHGAIRLAGFGALTGLFAPHLLYVLALVCGALGAWRFALPGAAPRRALLVSGAVAAGVTALLSAYWLLPSSMQPSILGRFTEADLAAFATRGDPAFGVSFNVAALYGFWRRVPLAKDALPGWWILTDVVIGLAATGCLRLWRDPARRWQTPALLSVAALAVFVAMGVAFAPTAAAWRWCFEHVPGFAGLREPQKAAAFLVVVYAYAGARGASWLVEAASQRVEWGRAVTWGLGIALLVVPLVAGWRELGGAAGVLTPVRYPASWYEAAAILERAEGEGAVLVLPWRQYSAYEFTRGGVVANPAPSVFPGRVIAGDDPGLDGVPYRPSDATHAAIDALLAGPTQPRASGVELARLGVQYVLVVATPDLTLPASAPGDGLRLLRRWDDLALYEGEGSEVAAGPAPPARDPGVDLLGAAISLLAGSAVLAPLTIEAVAKRLTAAAESRAHRPGG